ncbi:MAG: hypothetical protein HY689_02830 [Chloroflexi bacterium]|nr:hypothetical protein [Chloroflexota bacterium]
MTLSIDHVLLLLGSHLSDHGNEKDRFRQFIEQDEWTKEDYERWLSECAQNGGASARIYYNALQDIVISIGKRLGFEIEYGRYAGSTTDVAFDGMWKRASGEILLLEVKTSTWPIESVGQLGGYLDRFAAERNLPAQQVFGLYVIGRGDLRPIIDQIKGSEHRNVLRVVTFGDLLKLWKLKDDLDKVGGSGAGSTKVQAILLPIESVNIGSFIDLVLEIAELNRITGEEGEQAEEPQFLGEEPWNPVVLREFLNACTGFQRALLTSLALSEIVPLPRKNVIHTMQQVATLIPDIQARDITGYTLAAARAGFKMRRGNKEDFILEDNGTYTIKLPYKEIITDWIKNQNLYIPQVSQPQE